MRKRRRVPGLSYANVVATLALFVALGGASYAAFKLPKKSVGTKQLKKNAVTRQKVRRNAINGAKVKNHSLRANDFKAGQLPAGPQGEQGPPGEDATSLFAYVNDPSPNKPANIGYGKGATGVTDPEGTNNFTSPYEVEFNRDLKGCVANVTPGTGDPPGTVGTDTISETHAAITGSVVKVSFRSAAFSANQDEPFMVTVFC